MVAQHRQPASERAGHHGRERPGAGDELQAELVAIAFDRRGTRSGALCAEHDRLAAGRPEQRRQLSARPVQVRLDDLQREPRRNGRVERIAALLENGHARRGREPVRRRDHPEGAAQFRAGRERHDLTLSA